MRRRINHHRFTPFVASCAFDSTLAFVACPRLAENEWSPLSLPDGWFSKSFAGSHVHEVGRAVVSLQKRNTIAEIGQDGVFAARQVIWAVYVSVQSCVADVVGYLGLAWRQEEVDADVPPCSPDVTADVFGADSETEGNRDLSDIPPCGSINVRSSLQADF